MSRPDAAAVNDLRQHIITTLDSYAAPAELIADSWVWERSELVLTVRGHVAAQRIAAELGLARDGGVQWVGRWEGLNVVVHTPIPAPGRPGAGHPLGAGR